MNILVEETMRAKEIALSHDYLTKVLDYNSETDEFIWKISPSRNIKVGTRVGAGGAGGAVNKTGYRLISINNIRYKAGRLAWFYHYGEWPSADETPPWIDHINGNRPEGHIANLRQITDEQNSRNQKVRSTNNTPGRAGVQFYKPRGKWMAVIRNNGKYECLGYYAKFEDAVKAREAAEIKYGYAVRKEA